MSDTVASTTLKHGRSPSPGKKRGGHVNHAYFHESRGKKEEGKERLSYLSTYLHIKVFLSFSQKFSRSLRSLDSILSPIKNASMQRDFINPILSCIFVLLSFTSSFRNALNTSKIAQGGV